MRGDLADLTMQGLSVSIASCAATLTHKLILTAADVVMLAMTTVATGSEGICTGVEGVVFQATTASEREALPTSPCRRARSRHPTADGKVRPGTFSVVAAVTGVFVCRSFNIFSQSRYFGTNTSLI